MIKSNGNEAMGNRTPMQMVAPREGVSAQPSPRKAETAPREQRPAMTFVFAAAPQAKDVFVAGDFNNWDPTATRMTRRGSEFKRKIELAPGEHQYKFVVDGQWVADPASDVHVVNDLGTVNSVIRV